MEGVSSFSSVGIVDEKAEILIDERDDLIEIQVDLRQIVPFGQAIGVEKMLPSEQFFRDLIFIVQHEMCSFRRDFVLYYSTASRFKISQMLFFAMNLFT